MSDNNKFEQLIELFIAEDEQGAKDLFHEIVVEKSRDIYESLVDEEQVEETAEVEEDAEAVEESEDEAVEESEEEAVEESGFEEAEIGGDQSDDMIDDIEADEQGLSMEADADDEEIEDRVVDIENALEELKAEFDALMGGDDAEGGDAEMDMDMDMDAGDEEGDEEEGDEEEMESVEEETEEMVREYTEKAPAPVTAEQGDGSTGPVAGKNDMGGSAKNLAQGGEEKGGATPKSTVQTDAANPKGATMSKA